MANNPPPPKTKDEGIKQAQIDAKASSTGCSSTNGWSSQASEAYTAELNRLRKKS